MIQTITKSDFRDAFGRMGRGEQFSYEALGALFDYYEELEESTGDQIELDVIAICCEWCEYDDLEELQRNYTNIEDLDDLTDNTQVIELDNGGLIVMGF